MPFLRAGQSKQYYMRVVHFGSSSSQSDDGITGNASSSSGVLSLEVPLPGSAELTALSITVCAEHEELCAQVHRVGLNSSADSTPTREPGEATPEAEHSACNSAAPNGTALPAVVVFYARDGDYRVFRSLEIFHPTNSPSHCAASHSDSNPSLSFTHGPVGPMAFRKVSGVFFFCC